MVCLECNQQTSRHDLQHRIKELNPTWEAIAGSHAPDGDTFLTDEEVQDFIVPACLNCGGILKPQVVFFGDSVPKETVSFVHQRLLESDSVLIVGSSLEVYSSYRFAHAAWQQNKPIAIFNIGPTRADKLASIKISAIVGDVLPRLKILSAGTGVNHIRKLWNMEIFLYGVIESKLTFYLDISWIIPPNINWLSM